MTYVKLLEALAVFFQATNEEHRLISKFMGRPVYKSI
jgi:hypothetical protein